MVKIDQKKTLKPFYSPPRTGFHLVDVPPLQVLAIDGHGDPNTAQSFKEAIEALFALSYGLKFLLKKSDPALDYVVMPLEACWSARDMTAFDTRTKQDWDWTAMIVQPPDTTVEMLEDIRAAKRAKIATQALENTRLEWFDEGRCVQCLHIGPFDDEGPRIAAMHDFIAAEGLRLRGRHHEIYLSDMRRTAPEKLRTILRQPVG